MNDNSQIYENNMPEQTDMCDKGHDNQIAQRNHHVNQNKTPSNPSSRYMPRESIF